MNQWVQVEESMRITRKLWRLDPHESDGSCSDAGREQLLNNHHLPQIQSLKTFYSISNHIFSSFFCILLYFVLIVGPEVTLAFDWSGPLRPVLMSRWRRGQGVLCLVTSGPAPHPSFPVAARLVLHCNSFNRFLSLSLPPTHPPHLCPSPGAKHHPQAPLSLSRNAAGDIPHLRRVARTCACGAGSDIIAHLCVPHVVSVIEASSHVFDFSTALTSDLQ